MFSEASVYDGGGEGSASSGGLPIPRYWHLVAANTVDGMCPTGMHPCLTILILVVGDLLFYFHLIRYTY